MTYTICSWILKTTYYLVHFYQALLIFLFLNLSCYTQESKVDISTFNREWSQFIQSNGIDYTRVGAEDYQEYEFSLLEEFSDQQFERYRPYIQAIDRYNNCRPYNENKIVLLDGTEMSASLIDLTYFKENYHNFIATQAPFEHNISLFWKMVFENHIDQIVMLTELFETRNPSKELAYPYWPKQVGEKLSLENGLEITLIEESELLSELNEKIQIRKIKLQNQEQERFITHYWYRHWMDDSAPNQPQTMLTLIKIVEEHKISSKLTTPILVHCAAGVGRTGVFIALYHLMQRIKYKDQKIPFFDFVAYLRWQRPYLVGVLSQYQFCYQVSAILETGYFLE